MHCHGNDVPRGWKRKKRKLTLEGLPGGPVRSMTTCDINITNMIEADGGNMCAPKNRVTQRSQMHKQAAILDQQNEARGVAARMITPMWAGWALPSSSTAPMSYSGPCSAGGESPSIQFQGRGSFFTGSRVQWYAYGRHALLLLMGVLLGFLLSDRY